MKNYRSRAHLIPPNGVCPRGALLLPLGDLRAGHARFRACDFHAALAAARQQVRTELLTRSGPDLHFAAVAAAARSVLDGCAPLARPEADGLLPLLVHVLAGIAFVEYWR
ncbi:MAG: hypothetical protein J0I21_11445 [Alphaproteobacteria bacterium]|nr:hypothetical protein [Alphaproteobacteria bacterium]